MDEFSLQQIRDSFDDILNNFFPLNTPGKIEAYAAQYRNILPSLNGALKIRAQELAEQQPEKSEEIAKESIELFQGFEKKYAPK